MIFSNVSNCSSTEGPLSISFPRFFIQSKAAASRVEVTKTNKGMEGFQCYEPLLYGLTLGVIPINCVDMYAVSVTSSTGETAQGTYKVSVWVGWASVLLAPLPNWHWQMGYGHGVDPAGEIEGRVRDASR
jgi:hypothetical protein